MTTKSSKVPPPYMSFGVFKSTIETLAETIVPSGPLDRRVLHGLSGADYGALMSGLHFLALVDDERRATEKYRALVQASKDSEKFKELFLVILLDKYGPIIGKLNLKHGTIAELEKAFKDYGVGAGQMLTKSIRFFLKAMTEAGVTPGPHMTVSKSRTPSTAAKKNTLERARARSKPQREELHGEEVTPPSGFERLPLPGVPNSFIQYPVNLTEAHCQILEGMVGVLRTSVKARTGRKETKP
jgi:hypothetical protein